MRQSLAFFSAAIFVSLLSSFWIYQTTLLDLPLLVRRSPQRDTCWAETIVHPTLLWHPFPRNILISGSATKFHVKEVLRHFATTPIHWLDQTSPQDSVEDDVLHRVVQHPFQATEYFLTSSNASFDIAILDRPPTPALVLKAAERLASGGVLAMALPSSWEPVLKQAFRVFKHVHVFMPYDSVGRTSYYAIATNSDAYPPPGHLSVAYINTLLGRRVAFKNLLQHYDGEAHLRSFLLPRRIREQVRDAYRKHTQSASSLVDFTPFGFATLNDTLVYPKATTLTRCFLRCAYLPSSESEAIRIVLQSLKNGEAINRGILSSFWNMHSDINTTTHSPPPDHPSTTDQLTITTIFDGGSLSLDIIPHLGFCRASITNLNKWVSTEEILDHLRVTFAPMRTSGYSHTSPSRLIPAGTLDEGMSYFGDKETGSVDYWMLDVPYWSSPKVELRASPVNGMGNWAKENIAEGEVVFKGPIEGSLVHLEEYNLYPEWKKLYIDHYGEQAHDEILVAPSRAEEDLSYFTNHACSPNIRYDDSYDRMIAVRDIAAGEELTFHYATVSAELDFELQCNCRAPDCRRRVFGGDWKDQELVAKLGKEAFWPFIKAKILKLEQGKGIDRP